MYVHVHTHTHTHTHTHHRKLTRNEHFELRDLKEILAGGNYSKHQPQQAGMVRIPSQEGLMVTSLYYDFVQVEHLHACRHIRYADTFYSKA